MTTPDPYRTRLRDWVLAVVVVLIIAVSPADAPAHTITVDDCRAVAAHTTGPTSVKRAAGRGCVRSSAAHAVDHQHADCRRLPGGYQARNACTIRIVFGAAGEDAVDVATCESGLSPRAANGQYLGLFQASAAWRRDLAGYGPTAREQAEHGLRIYNAVGRDWSPTWECAP